jgi:hypothetical protein
MKKLILLAILTLPVMAFSQINHASNSNFANADVEVVAAVQSSLQLSKIQDLWFGSFIAGTGSTTSVVSADPNATADNGTQPGIVEVLGAASADVVFNFSGGAGEFDTANDPPSTAPSVTYTLDLTNANSDILPVDLTFFYNNASYTPGATVGLDVDGEGTIRIGGTITFDQGVDGNNDPNPVATGVYKGTVTVTASYI